MNSKLTFTALLAITLTVLLCLLWGAPLLWAISTALRLEASGSKCLPYSCSGLLPDPAALSEASTGVRPRGICPAFHGMRGYLLPRLPLRAADHCAGGLQLQLMFLCI